MLQLIHPFYKEGIMGINPMASYKRSLQDKNSIIGFIFTSKSYSPDNALGFIYLIKRKRGGLISKVEPPFCQIKQILVSKNSQDKGMGTALLKWGLNRMESLPVVAQVMPTNKSAIMFYKKRHFKCIETLYCGKDKTRKELLFVRRAS
jgi:ribosomal protein S18 acetylase RimI-like enzyme